MSQRIQRGVDKAEGERQGHLASVHLSLQDLERLWGHMGKSVGRVWGLKKRKQVQSCPFILLGSLPIAHSRSTLVIRSVLFFLNSESPYFLWPTSWACRSNCYVRFFSDGTIDILGQAVLYWGVVMVVGLSCEFCDFHHHLWPLPSR